MVSDILIYQAEHDAGLEDVIKANASIAYLTALEAVEPTELVLGLLQRTHATNKNQPDLHYLKSVLVTTGWNKNDDVFSQEETWAARNTPEDKPVNLEHDCHQIIGHMTANYVIDDDSKIIDSQTVVDDLPDIFHIITNSVLYKVWDDDEIEEKVAKIIAEIVQNEWFVSMEAIFAGFDYAVIAPGGQNKVIARNKHTAFLTKHLKAYGGNGIYNDNRVGRLMRNLTFSAKGLVKTPANPKSIILSSTAVFKGACLQKWHNNNSLGYSSVQGCDNLQEKDMGSETELLQNQLNEMKTQVKVLTEQNKELQTKVAQANVDNLQTQVEELTTSNAEKENVVTDLQGKLDAANTSLEENKIKVEELATKLEAAEKRNGEFEKTLAKIKAEEQKRQRISSLVKAGLTKEEAIEKTDKLSGLTDEQFQEVIVIVAAHKDDDTNNEPDERTIAGDVLDDAESNEGGGSSLATDGDSAVESTRAALSAAIGAWLHDADEPSNDEESE